jgi:hypothetical protein
VNSSRAVERALAKRNFDARLLRGTFGNSYREKLAIGVKLRDFALPASRGDDDSAHTQVREGAREISKSNSEGAVGSRRIGEHVIGGTQDRVHSVHGGYEYNARPYTHAGHEHGVYSIDREYREHGASGALGSAESFDASDIGRLLEEPAEDAPQEPTADAPAAGASDAPEYVFDIHVYPEDKFSELKSKIYLATGIPAYRQHLFYMTGTRVNTTYKLYARGLQTVDIRTVSAAADSARVMGLPIDKLLYDARDELRVESSDDFELVGSRVDDTVYVVDIAQFVTPQRVRAEIVGDQYKMDLVYYGFVLKYWPMLTPECFTDYVVDERELGQKYPDLAPSRTLLTTRAVTEREIVDYDYAHAQRAFNVVESAGITIAIIAMTAYVNTTRTQINTRNLFDKLRVSRCIPEIHARIQHGGKTYLLRKRHVKCASDIPFPSGAFMTAGVTIAISMQKRDQESFHAKSSVSTVENEQSRYMFLNIQPTGRYYVKTLWNEEDERGFEDVMRLMRKFTDGVLRGINALGRYVFIEGGPLPLLTRYNVRYQTLNICLFWKRVILESAFKAVKALWEPYLRAGITAPRNVQQFDKYEFLFCKGMHEFDPALIESIVSASHNVVLANYYAHLSSSAIRQKWQQNYAGRIVRMSHRTTDVRFEVLGIHEDEFAVFYRYIVLFVYRAVNDPRVAGADAARDYRDVRLLRKLREQDPELYNIKKYGSTKTYSQKCQKQHQPLIYTRDEIAKMSPRQVRSLTQYWNFTLDRPAYYSCPNRKYPHLTFLVNVHPKHYCMPCCGKTSRVEESRKAREYRICLSKHRFMVGDTEHADISRHTLKYGKDIDQSRLGNVPPAARDLLFNTLRDSRLRYYMYGVAQHVPGAENVGVFFSVAEALETTPRELTERLVRAVTPTTFDTLLDGMLPEYWHNADEFVATLRDLFVNRTMFSREYQRFDAWERLFTEMFYTLIDVGVVMLIDVDGAGAQSLELYVPAAIAHDIVHAARARDGGLDADDATYVIVVKRFRKCYPIFIADEERYRRSLEIYARTFRAGDGVINLVQQMVQYNIASRAASVNAAYNLDVVSGVPGWRVVLKYVNRQNLCYAVAVVRARGRRTATAAAAGIGDVADGESAEFSLEGGAHSIMRDIAEGDIADGKSAGESTGESTDSAESRRGHAGAARGRGGTGSQRGDGDGDITYVPLDYSMYASDGIPITFEPLSSKTPLNAHTLLDFLADLNAHIRKNFRIGNEMYAYDAVVMKRFLSVGGKRVAAESRYFLYYADWDAVDIVGLANVGVASTPSIRDYATSPPGRETTDRSTDGPKASQPGRAAASAILPAGIPTVDTRYDYRDVNALVASRAPAESDPTTTRLGESLYRAYKYQLFVVEFVAFLERERNAEIRNRIKNAIATTNLRKELPKFVSMVRELLRDYPLDYALLQRQLSEYYYEHLDKNRLTADIDATVYDFDHMTMNRLRAMPPDEMRRELRRICDGFAVERKFDTSDVRFPNVYLPCADVESAYCDGKKLMLDTPIEPFVDILASDIRDNLHSRYLMSGIFADTVLSYLQFEQPRTESVVVYRLQE